MDANSDSILCDGCGLPASPEHIAARMERLELATRFRPIHINVLFVALTPMPRPEDDFYRPPESPDIFDSFLSALDIAPEAGTAKLLEFQRRGYYLTCLSECPVTPRGSANPGRELPLPGAGQETGDNASRECISRLAPTLVKRIRFNYKPKRVALLGTDMGPLVEIFERAGMDPLLILGQGAPLTISGCRLYLGPL
jgi:hypothetical protein